MTVLRTQSLILRPFEATDVAAYATIRADPAVVRWLPGGEAAAARASEIACGAVAYFIAQWSTIGYGPFAVVERASDRLVGHAGLRYLPEMNGETEILYMLERGVWGRGYATEAAIASRDYAFDVLALPRVMGMALLDNIASIRVLEKAGLPFERMARFADLDVACHARDARPGAVEAPRDPDERSV